MVLSYKELKKRDVINMVDGKNFGAITDMSLIFPEGLLSGIFVYDGKSGFLSRLFNRNKIFIDEKHIIKIGGDVILVNVSCGETCTPNINVNPPPKKKCPPSPCDPCSSDSVNGRIDMGDY